MDFLNLKEPSYIGGDGAMDPEHCSHFMALGSMGSIFTLLLRPLANLIPSGVSICSSMAKVFGLTQTNPWTENSGAAS